MTTIEQAVHPSRLQLIQRAFTLHAAGESWEVIADALGVTVGLVRRWVDSDIHPSNRDRHNARTQAQADGRALNREIAALARRGWFSHAEIADLLGITDSQVRRRLARIEAAGVDVSPDAAYRRDQEILRLVNGGATYREAAEALGTSRKRIAERMRSMREKGVEAHTSAPAPVPAERSLEAVRLVESGLTTAEAAAQLDWKAGSVASVVHRENRRRRRMGAPLVGDFHMVNRPIDPDSPHRAEDEAQREQAQARIAAWGGPAYTTLVGDEPTP